jgi:hypothetical protein
MRGAAEFLGTIRTRELRAIDRLFAGVADPFGLHDTGGSPSPG